MKQLGRRSKLAAEPGLDVRRAEIVRFWRTVELFNPQKVDPVDSQQQVFGVRPGAPLPWEPEHQLARWKLEENQAWRHVVYLGVFRLEEMFDVLSRVFPAVAGSYNERPPGESALAAFAVGEDGRAVVDTEVLSSCAWATGQASREGQVGRDWLSGFRDATVDFREAWRELVTNEHQDGSSQQDGRVLDLDAVLECLDLAVGATGMGELVSCTQIRISSQFVARRKADEPGGTDFLNSLIMDDLEHVAERIAMGDIGTALRAYLTPDDEISKTDRVDVREAISTVVERTAPDRVPAGRWPSRPAHALALNQQLAVNTAFGMTGAGVMGVNGPPGTGKTTMLRDLIAALIVQRATRLATLSDPDEAFTGEQRRWKTGKYTRVVSPLRPELTGFEIVVASANNTAVQNITDEIPAAEAIDSSWHDQAATLDYFPEIATALLAPESDGHVRQPAQASEQGWALVAARLGNKANRRRFTSAFWYHTPNQPNDDDAWFGLNEALKTYADGGGTPRPWSDAVDAFRDAEARVKAIRAERMRVYQAFQRREHLRDTLDDLRERVAQAVKRVEKATAQREAAVGIQRERAAEAERIALRQQAEAEQAARQRGEIAEQLVRQRTAELLRFVAGPLASAERIVGTWTAESSRRWDTRAAHQASRPGLWKRLISFGTAGRAWTRKDRWLATQVEEARQDLAHAHHQLDVAHGQRASLQQDIDSAQHELDAIRRLLAAGVPKPTITHPPLVAANREVAQAKDTETEAHLAQTASEKSLRDCETEIAALDKQLKRDAAPLSDHYPHERWWNKREHREKAALWTDAGWNQARTELFVAALALHKTFLQHAAGQMRRNLQAAMDLVTGEAPRDLDAESALAAWQNLFFVVPVVSTTFASYARLFGHVGTESLGWLLIDEAGQATPQNAVGALWRTQHAVVVGDPLQLKPIVTLPFSAEDAIRDTLGVGEEWSTHGTSVQVRADALTSLGTTLPVGDGDETWVGVPLTVHRRCDHPMFTIVNSIAYGGLMINGIGRDAQQRFTAAYPDLPPSIWIDVESRDAQGNWIPAEGRELDHLLRTLATHKFRMSDVMVIGPFRDVARQIARRTRQYTGLTGGTVHTAQGKEADIVILVLGGAPDRVGARGWASSEPNLLNVAISRAKRRLYIIGDWENWARLPYFKTAAAYLKRTDPVQR
ncbi:AAA domain-containing protein [Actinocrispum sp. NPDC049592]|uniref:DEAD/DEAH box helicase n=1 Tax=Actinocrispum sp. NPDC049592 TaxID=3154835 RepID=UPI0034251E4E